MVKQGGFGSWEYTGGSACPLTPPQTNVVEASGNRRHREMIITQSSYTDLRTEPGVREQSVRKNVPLGTFFRYVYVLVSSNVPCVV